MNLSFLKFLHATIRIITIILMIPMLFMLLRGAVLIAVPATGLAIGSFMWCFFLRQSIAKKEKELAAQESSMVTDTPPSAAVSG